MRTNKYCPRSEKNIMGKPQGKSNLYIYISIKGKHFI